LIESTARPPKNSLILRQLLAQAVSFRRGFGGRMLRENMVGNLKPLEVERALRIIVVPNRLYLRSEYS
jgi:hypothetical protein